MNSKKGLTMLTMVLYVFLFFTFIVFAVSLSSNINYATLSQKGLTIINEDFSKLQYNLFVSAKASSFVQTVENRLVFSNNDEYTFDTKAGKIYKNGGVLVSDVTNFGPSLDVITTNVLIDSSNYFNYTVTFLKYNNTVTKKIFITVGDVSNE